MSINTNLSKNVNTDIEKIVGSANVIMDENILNSFTGDESFITGEKPYCLVRPVNMEQVREIIKLAAEAGVALIPCSSKGPRFRGDTVPSVRDSVIVDLSAMDKILRIDKRNKVAMIEPGVTFEMLKDAIEREGLRANMPLCPRKTKSVIGSCIEREPCMIPKYHWDMSDPMCCMEVVFGAGEMFRTGSAAGPGTLEEQWASGQAQKSPMGPSQSDFGKLVQGSQGTLGIVTWITLKLELLPSMKKSFFIASETLDDIVEFTYRILKPKLPDECFILNRVDLAVIAGISDLKNIPQWFLFYSIAGGKHFPEDRINYLEKDILDIAGETGVVPMQSNAYLSADKLVEIVNKPGTEPYWKLRSRGGCQDIFFLTTLDKADEFITIMNSEIKKHGFNKDDIGAYIQPIQQGRNCHLEFDIMYNPEDPQETQRVKQLFESASKAMIDNGGFFSRPYGIWSDLAYSKCPDTVSALKKVKKILDPGGVMNPGKLCFGKEV